MPVGKIRSKQRSSQNSSYVSTVTTIVFIALCILAAWMLTSNSFSSPDINTSIVTATKLPKNSKPDASHPFEDNPGDLPEDAIINDQTTDNSVNLDAVKIKDEEVVVRDPNAIVEENPEGFKGKMSEEEETKQRELDTQTSEESTLTIQGHGEISDLKIEPVVEQIASNVEQENGVGESKPKEVEIPKKDVVEIPKKDKVDIPKKDKVETRRKPKKGKRTRRHEPKSQDISDAEQENRVKQHKVQEVEQHQESGITSTDQIAHDESRIESQTEERKQIKTDKEHVKPPKGNSFSATGIPKESIESKKDWSTQAAQSDNQIERRQDSSSGTFEFTWQLCNVTANTDYIPCLDNEKAIKKLHSRAHYEHRERHCPEESPSCLVPLPEGYQKPVEWPHSRNKIWYHNVPHTLLAEVKGHQNWVKVAGEFLTFPGGGTQFIHGALHYIDFIQEAVPEISWGKRTRVVLDVGCGVASFGGYLFERDVVTMSFAPKDEHEAQVQFALERGIPAISAVMGTKRLPFPSRVFDLVHCARCRVPWHADGGALLLELNRVLRPGGYFVWSATPVYQKLEEDVQIWKEMSKLTISMCWELVTIKKDKLNSVGAAIYQKPQTNQCYESRKNKSPPMCKPDDDPNAAWYVPLQSCIYKLPTDENERGAQWPEEWPCRLQTSPYWLNKTQRGIYGKPAADDFEADYQHWVNVVKDTYINDLGITWNDVRNVMDMRAVYGGFAAALKEYNVWVMNVVNVNSPDTLPIIYERGLFGIYHDWCESFSTYPRTYDLLHADHLFAKLKARCKLVPVMAEIDRIVRPGGKLIVRDESGIIGEIENILKSLHWEVHLTFSKNHEGILSAQKSFWRPATYALPS